MSFDSNILKVAVRSLKTEAHKLPVWQEREAVGTGDRCLETRFANSITEWGLLLGTNLSRRASVFIVLGTHLGKFSHSVNGRRLLARSDSPNACSEEGCTRGAKKTKYLYQAIRGWPRAAQAYLKQNVLRVRSVAGFSTPGSNPL